MWDLIEAALLTGAMFIGDIVANSKRGFLYYFYLFIVFFGIIFLFSNKIHAEELGYSYDGKKSFSKLQGSFLPDAKKEIEMLRIFKAQGGFQFALSKKDRKFYQEKVKFHKENGEKAYRDAKKKCWWLPDTSDRDKAKYCFTTAISLIAPNNPKSKLMGAILTLLLQYGLDCMDEWNYIQNKLHLSEYHFEMMEFYQEVLQQDKKK